MRRIRPMSCLVWMAMVWIGASCLPVAMAGAVEAPKPAAVTLLEVPEGGIQPQAAVDDRGAVHLVYYKGDPAGGDLFYARLDPGAGRFTTPVRVNSQPGSAIAMGTIRGGQIAVGRGGRIHVAWNGSNGARPQNPAGSNPMLYSRSDPGGKTFEPQRNLMNRTSALDGGGTVAADREGNVYVAWHGRTEDAGPGEAHRRMWVVRSKDDGATFSTEETAIDRETGACGCCGTRAMAGRDGTVYMLYRAATGGVDRDMYLLHSEDHAGRFEGASISPWRAEGCPMSSAALAESGPGVLAAWETKGQVFFARVDPRTHRASAPIAPLGGRGDRKHPAVAGNDRGETILVWDEGTGWQKGGSMAWQVFDRSGRPSGPSGSTRGGVPVWGFAAVVARPDGSFAIITSRVPAGASARLQGEGRPIGAAAGRDPRVARLAERLNEARTIDEEIDAAYDLLRLDSEPARDVAAAHAARSPLRAFDRTSRVLLIADGPSGEVYEVITAKPAGGIIVEPGTPPDLVPELAAAVERSLENTRSKQSFSIGKPAIRWSAVYRLPDGAVLADEQGAEDSVSFLLRPRAHHDHIRVGFKFRGDRIEEEATYDVTDAQLRRWKASDWWPKDWH